MKDSKDNLGEYLSKFAETQSSLMRSINLDAYTKTANILSSNLYFIDQANRMAELSRSISDQQMSNILSMNLHLEIPEPKLAEILRMQVSTYLLIEQSIKTPMISAIKESLLASNIASSCNSISRALSQPIIEAADIAFLKMSNIVAVCGSELTLPHGFNTILQGLNVSSAKRLAKCEDISLDKLNRSFFNEANPESGVNITEINSLCSAADLFDATGSEDVEESELIDFMTFLSQTPMFATEHAVGQKIRRVVNNWADKVDFDHGVFYHARPRTTDQCPYTFDQMVSCPTGIPGPGRYNHPGQAHYYFSDTREGAEKEIKKHCNKDNVVQIAEIRPVHTICMIDLSETKRNGSMFLKYIRYPVQEIASKMPKEYLIPCFVSDCCKNCGINGIKFYGGADYSNYVSWNSGYFEYSRMM